jgi:hypothetical protein
MSSRKRLARFAGFLYLVVAVLGAFAYGFVVTRVYVPGDAAATAANVVANAGLVRAGVVADLIQATVFVFVAMALYLLLRHVHENRARAMVVLVAIAATITCLDLVFELASLLVATDLSYATAFGTAGSDALVLLLLDLQHDGYLVAQIFFGLWLIPIGAIAYRSTMFPRALGVALIVAGASYVTDTLLSFLVPDLGTVLHSFLIIPPIFGEVWLLGYLLVRGVRAMDPADSRPIAVPGRAPVAM